MDKEELARRSAADFRFLVICQMRGDMAMYELMRDREVAIARQNAVKAAQPETKKKD